LKTAAVCFGVNRKTFENGALRERCSHFNHVISLSEFFSNTNPKQAMIVAFSKLLRSIVKTLDVFSERNLRFQIPLTTTTEDLITKIGTKLSKTITET